MIEQEKKDKEELRRLIKSYPYTATKILEEIDKDLEKSIKKKKKNK